MFGIVFCIERLNWNRESTDLVGILRSEEEIFKDLKEAVLRYDKGSATKCSEEVLSRGIDPLKAIENGLAIGMKEIGDKFGTECFLTDLILAAETMKTAMAVLERGMKVGVSERMAGTVVIGTTKGDIHDIGKNLVSIMLAAGGFKVIDLGVDVPSETFIHKAEETKAHIIACSALLSTTIGYMDELIHLLKELGSREKYKVMVGGAQVTAAFAKEIGADGYAEEAAQVPTLAKQLLGT